MTLDDLSPDQRDRAIQAISRACATSSAFWHRYFRHTGIGRFDTPDAAMIEARLPHIVEARPEFIRDAIA